ncbi:MAG: Rab family GTPase [Promethearchaeota archaeon]
MAYPGHPHYIFKICIIGQESVGKTCIARRLCFNTFESETKMTIGINFYTYDLPLEVDSKSTHLRLSIWDFGGQEQFKKLFPYYINGANGIFLCFELINLQSLINLDWWYEKLIEYNVQKIPRVVLGTKQDLTKTVKHKTKVEDAIIASFLNKHNEKDFFKTSSKENINIVSSFKTLVKKILDKTELDYDKLP